MIERLKENRTFYICLSVVLAILFWLYVREVEDPVMDGNVWNVPIELTGESILASQGLAVAEISEETADFKVSAPASVLEGLSRKNVTAIVDVSKCVAGEKVAGIGVSVIVNGLTVSVKSLKECVLNNSAVYIVVLAVDYTVSNLDCLVAVKIIYCAVNNYSST